MCKISKHLFMKNLKGIILTMALAAILSGQIFAQAVAPAASEDQTTKQPTTQVQACGKFVDNNNNGICDNCEALQGKGSKGADFVDANGDGICDHRVDGNCGKCDQGCCKGQGNGCCKGMGSQHKHGCGMSCGVQRDPVKK
jgi:hypothetical protein